MPNTRTLAVLLWAAAWSIPAPAQNTAGQFWPELGYYIQQGDILRLEITQSGAIDKTASGSQGNFSVYVRAALKPVFRRELRDRPDVYQNRYLSFRAGYRYRTSLSDGGTASENRGIIELIPQYHLPWHLIISNRNRGEFRFIKGQSFSTRYRGRFQIERDFDLGRLVCTPYAYDEIFYDTRYDRWTPNRYAFGVQLPVGPHVILDPYYLRQHSSTSTPAHTNVFGFKVNLYF